MQATADGSTLNNESPLLDRPARTEVAAKTDTASKDREKSRRNKLLSLAKKVFTTEADAVAALSLSLDANFADACDLLLACRGRVVVCGVGKSGHIANKIAATLASTGTPAFFVHPAEASHGDLGMIRADDVIIALSYGGESSEIKTILPLVKRLGIPVIAITGKTNSSLAQSASAVLNVAVAREACPLGLAPTSSTTATLAMGDALAVVLLETRGFSAADFAMTHPGGKLGRKLLLTVADVMVSDHASPTVSTGTLLRDALYTMSAGQLGFLTVIDANKQLLGVFTDGDLRRALDLDIDINKTLIDDVMTKGGYNVTAQQLAVDALELMEKHKIYALPVLDANATVCGALNMHSLLQAGVV